MRSRREVPNAPPQAPWLPRRDTVVLLLSPDPDLQGAVGRVCAAAAVELVIAENMDRAAGQWEEASALLLDARLPTVDGGVAGWSGVTVIVGFGPNAAQVWQRAEQEGADKVAILPDSASWLANYLGCLRSSTPGAGVVGILGASGGAGASTLAVMVAVAAAARGTRTLLVDGDPLGGGIETALAAQHVPGLRWPELLHASGTINPEHLAASLPQLASLALLSWSSAPPRDDGPASTAAVGEVMRAARAAYGLVVVDLPRTPQALGPLVGHCSGAVFVVPARARATAATVALAPLLPPMPLTAAVRGPLGEGLDAAMVAGAVGMPLIGVLPRLHGVGEALESQRIHDLVRRRKVRTLVANLLAWLGEEVPQGRGRLQP